MRPAPADVITLLNSRLPFVYADCFTFTLSDGTKLRYTNAQQPLTFIPVGEINPVTFRSTEVLIEGMVLKSSLGIDVDEQDCEIFAYPSAEVDSQPFFQALRQGSFDGAILTRERVYMYDWGLPIQGSIVLFTGRVSTIDPGGDTRALMKVKSEMVVLDEEMPRNFFQMQCKNTLFDGACSLIKSSFATSGATEAGTTRLTINWSSATADYYDLGTITVEAGLNVGQSRTIRKSTGGSLVLVTPFEYDFADGDIFKAYPGCDLQRSTCAGKFSNEENFRGFPYVPNPETAY